jgi:hypothetical protein
MQRMNRNLPVRSRRIVRGSLLVTAFATVLMLGFASTALAVNHAGQLRSGAAVTATAAIGSNPASLTAGAGTYTYLDWSNSLGGNNSGISAGANSPHGAFTTTTVKCAVCHSVHYSAPGNAPIGSGQAADTLLRMTAGNACAYCHVVAGQTVNGRSVYDGVFVDDAHSGGSQNSGHATGTNCTECHTGPHGAGADTSVPSIVGYLLKKSKVATTAPYRTVFARIQAVDATAALQGFTSGAVAASQTVTGFDEGQWTDPANNGTAYREAAVGMFCVQCHAGSYSQTQSGATTNINGAASPTSGHRVQASVETTWTGHSSGAFEGKGQIAWADAANCKSCHDSKDTLGNQAFPHAWGGTKMWLVAAPSATEATEALPFGTAANSAYNLGRPQLSDGVCLKCHRSDSTTSGVGLSY